MTNTIVLTGVRNIKTDEQLKGNRDYGLFIVASLEGRYVPETFTDEEQKEFKYYLQVSHIDSLVDFKEKKDIAFVKGKSPSQILRWRITEKLGEEEYPNFMNWLIGNCDRLTEEYLEFLNNK